VEGKTLVRGLLLGGGAADVRSGRSLWGEAVKSWSSIGSREEGLVEYSMSNRLEGDVAKSWSSIGSREEGLVEDGVPNR